MALPFEAYFANIGNLTWFGQALLVFGGNGHVTKSAHTAPLSIWLYIYLVKAVTFRLLLANSLLSKSNIYKKTAN
nr:hypothetical protein [Mycoplasmoides pneumoniae]